MIGPIAPIQRALSGLQESLRRVEEDAETIAAEGADVDALVDLRVQRAAYSANLAVVRTADRMTGSLLDVLA